MYTGQGLGWRQRLCGKNSTMYEISVQCSIAKHVVVDVLLEEYESAALLCLLPLLKGLTTAPADECMPLHVYLKL